MKFLDLQYKEVEQENNKKKFMNLSKCKVN